MAHIVAVCGMEETAIVALATGPGEVLVDRKEVVFAIGIVAAVALVDRKMKDCP